MLVDAGAELETKGAATGYTPLIWSAAVGDSNSIPVLVRAGADIEARDSVDGGTPLMHAAQTGKFAGMKAVVEAKANVNAKSKRKDSSPACCRAQWWNRREDPTAPGQRCGDRCGVLIGTIGS